MQPGLASHLTAPIQLTLTGPAARTAMLSVNNATGRIAIDQKPDGAAAAEIISTATISSPGRHNASHGMKRSPSMETPQSPRTSSTTSTWYETRRDYTQRNCYE